MAEEAAKPQKAEKKDKEKKDKKPKEKKKSGPKAYKKLRACPKCGPGVHLAEHKDRFSCGKCGYSEKR